MNKRQKIILTESVIIILVTAIAVIAMINVKDWVNRSEAIRAMKQLGQRALEYRRVHGSIPPKSYIDSIKETLEGHVRLGDLQYRAQWVDFESKPDEILAYTERKYPSSLLSDGFVVLRLSGRVEWLDKPEFEKELTRLEDRKQMEIQHK